MACDDQKISPPTYSQPLPGSEFTLQADKGPKYIIVKCIFGSYVFSEVTKETFLAHYHSRFTKDYEWFGLVDEGLYTYIDKHANNWRSRILPFVRRIKDHYVKKYLHQRRSLNDDMRGSLSVGLGEEEFLTRACEGREGTVLVMWKRNYMFSPKSPKPAPVLPAVGRR
ncbi:hypothetical protein BDD12DRAFT_880560 [Trichophaea hybrida]|nr:hypothetical protein BDD12DRAFT_880560 [Trichophaea hybrida]